MQLASSSSSPPATYAIRGLYYDEALFYPPAARLYLGCDIPAGVKYQIGCVPIVLQPPYLGALKAWLYAGLFSIVDPSMLTIRLPMIIVQFASIVLLTATWAPRIGRASALVLFVILCTDTASTSTPASIGVHTR